MKDKKKPFKYERRSEDSFQKQAEGGGGSWARVFKDQFKTFKVKEGDHRIRILPPTFEGAEHYALSMWIHSSVGPDRETFLCLNKMRQEPCPVCEEHRRAQREGGDEKYVYSLRPYERRLVWIINRAPGAEADGPILYDMPYAKMDKMICAVAKDQETGEVLWIDDPDNGYDIFFNRKGTTQTGTVYSGHAPARRASPISRDEEQQQAWLDFITQHPLDSVLNYYSYEHIQSVFSGSAPRKGKTEEESQPARTRSEDPDRKAFAARMDADEEEAPRKPKAPIVADDDEDDDEPVPKKAKPKAVFLDDDDDEPAPPKKVAKKAAPVDDDGDDEPAPPATRQRSKAVVADDDDDEPAPPKKRKSVAVVADDDEDEE